MPLKSSLAASRAGEKDNAKDHTDFFHRHSGPSWRKRAKHAIKWLADGQDESIVKRYLSQAAPDEVIKAITNAALNLKHGPVRISRQRKKLFRRYSKSIEKLIDRSNPLSAKRRLLVRRVQKGGFLPLLPILAPILASALGALGAEFIPKLLGGSR